MSALKEHFRNGNRYPSTALYGDGTAGEKIAKILEEVSPSIEKRFVE